MNDESMKQLFGMDIGAVQPSQGMMQQSMGQSVPPADQMGSTWVHENLPYLNSFLSSQVGKEVNVGYIFGTGQATERRGKLVGVGYNYIVLQEEFSGQLLACDFYSIKFVRILN